MKETILSMNSLLVYGALFVAALLIAYFFLTLTSGLEKNVVSKSSKKKTSSKLGCLSVLILLLFAFSLVSFTAYLRAFHAFNAKELVAIVECAPPAAENTDFRLKLTPVLHEVPQEEQTFDMVGNQWAIGGDILKWSASMNFLGLHTYYRLTRLEGRYETAAETLEKRVSAYSLVEEEKNAIWRMLYEVGDLLPVATSAYGNTVYSYPTFGDRYMVYVTTSGFMAERIRPSTQKKAGDWLEEVLDYVRPQPKAPTPR